MYSYLNEHPQVYMSPKKEPQFFAADVFGHQRNVIAVEDYRRCFERADGARVVGEASTAYMVSRIAAEQIKSYSPGARILVMLRNPIDVMHALHSERLFMNTEHITDFGKAIHSDDARFWRAGRWKGQRVIRPSYREVASFPAQLKRFVDVFGRDRVHVVVYDDFRTDLAAEYAKLLAFLGVDPAPEARFYSAQCKPARSQHGCSGLVARSTRFGPPHCANSVTDAITANVGTDFESLQREVRTACCD